MRGVLEGCHRVHRAYASSTSSITHSISHCVSHFISRLKSLFISRAFRGQPQRKPLKDWSYCSRYYGKSRVVSLTSLVFVILAQKHTQTGIAKSAWRTESL